MPGTNVSQVTSGPVGFMLPPRDITEPKNVFKSVIRIYVPVVVIVMALLLVVNHHSFGCNRRHHRCGGDRPHSGVELPLIIRAQDRRQQALMADLPKRGFYAGRASLLAHDGKNVDCRVTGTFFLTATGVTFTPQEGAVSLHSTWVGTALAGFRLASNPGQIGVGPPNPHRTERQDEKRHGTRGTGRWLDDPPSSLSRSGPPAVREVPVAIG